VSVSSRSAVQAQGTAVAVWFTLALLYDLVLIGSLSVSGLAPHWLVAALALNPIDATRVMGVLALEPDLYLLGPAGAFLTERLGTAGAAMLLAVAVTCWTMLPVAAATFRFSLAAPKPVGEGGRTFRRKKSYETCTTDAGAGRVRSGLYNRLRIRRPRIGRA
jgi:hypothetical protein